MAEEKFRLFIGAEELNYSRCNVIETNDHIVDEAKIDIEGNANVSTASVIDFKKVDGSTTVFSGKIDELTKYAMWTGKILTNGYELLNIPIQQVYENKSPEYIVQDIIDNNTINLTFASSNSSGITLTKYIADAYAIDVIKDMMDLLQWKLRIDSSDNTYFESKGETNNGFIFTEGSNFNITSWVEDKSSMINHVKVIGGFENYATEETVSATATEFALTHKPKGVFKAVVSGSEVSPDDYTVDAEQKTCTFTSSKTDPTFSYSYDRPIIVENQDDVSVNTYGEIYQEIPAPWLETFADARRYSQNIMDVYSNPLIKAKGMQPIINFDRATNETIRIIDTIRNRDENLVITKIIYHGAEGQTEYEFGEREFVFFDWQREVQERVKKLERRFLNEDDIVFTKLIKNSMEATLTVVQTFEFDNIQNSFYLSSPTTNRLLTEVGGSRYNFEPDCSNNNNNGTWTGTAIAGAQYSNGPNDNLQAHFYLDTDSTDQSDNSNDGTDATITYTTGKISGSASFDGADSKITVSDHTSIQDIFDSGGTVSAWIYPDSDGEGSEGRIIDKSDAATEGYAIFLSDESAGVCKLTLWYAFDNTVGTWITTAREITIGAWNHIAIVYDNDAVGNNPTVYVNGTSVNLTESSTPVGTRVTDVGNDSIIGNRSDDAKTFDGEMEDIRVYDISLIESDIEDIYDSGTGTQDQAIGIARLGFATFNGSDHKDTVSDDSTIQDIFDSGGTVSAWIKPSSDGENNEGRIADKANWILFIDGESGSTVNLKFQQNFSGNSPVWTVTAGITLNKWNHIVVTYDSDATGNNPIIYINGVSQTVTESVVPSGTRVTDVGSDLTVGNNAAGSRTFDGDLDELQLFDSILTQSIVTSLLNKNATMSDCKLWHAFDNGRLGRRYTARAMVT